MKLPFFYLQGEYSKTFIVAFLGKPSKEKTGNILVGGYSPPPVLVKDQYISASFF